MRTINKDNFDSTYKFRNDEFKIGDIILIFNFIIVINILASKNLITDRLDYIILLNRILLKEYIEYPS